jgi:hypothetical protein
LKADLVTLTRKWRDFSRDSKEQYLIQFADDKSTEYIRLARAQSEAYDQLQASQDVVGIGHEGWVPLEKYDRLKARERKLKSGTLDAAKTDEERRKIQENWIFDDFCEEDYN